MTTTQLKIAILFVSVILLSACNGDKGEKSLNKLPKNEVLGNIPSLVLQKAQQDSTVKAEYKAEMEKFTEYTEKNLKKAEELTKKYKADLEEIELEFQANLTKEKAQLIGKSIPFEVADGIGYTISDLVITDVEKSGQVVCEHKAQVVDINIASINGNSKPELIITWTEMDNTGNQIGSNSAAYIGVSAKENNATGTNKMYISIRKKNAEQYVNFQKIKFIQS